MAVEKLISEYAPQSGHHRKNIEKSQHTDFNEDTTNESASVACSNVLLKGLRKILRAGFADSKETMSEFLIWSKEGTVRHC